MAAKRTRSPDALSVAGRKPEPPHLLSLISDVRSADLRLVDGPKTVRGIAETFAAMPAFQVYEPGRGSTTEKLVGLAVGETVLLGVGMARALAAVRAAQRHRWGADYTRRPFGQSYTHVERVR